MFKHSKKGNQLSPAERQQVLSRFVNRFTGNYTPPWSRIKRTDGSAYMVHFKDDEEWLANTEFAVTSSGKLDNSAKYCFSTPTWPNGKNEPKQGD